MPDRLLVSLSRFGRDYQLVMTEYDKHRNVIYRVTYPVTYTEACDLSHWASLRNLKRLCDTYLTANGWDVWLAIGSVINTDVTFTPLHDNHRKGYLHPLEASSLIDGHHSITVDIVN